MMEGRTYRNPWHKVAAAFFCMALGVGCALAFVVGQEGYVGMSAQPAAATSYLWSALGLAFGLLFWQAFGKRALGLRWLPLVGGLLFGVLNFLATTLFAYDDWPFLQSGGRLLLAALQCLGQGLPMVAALALMDALLRGGLMTREPKAGPLSLPLPRLRALYREHTAAFCMAMFALCWLPYLVLFYPGTMSWDMGEMIAQFFGQRPLEAWDPVFTTGILGACMWLGRLVGSDNLGALLYMLLQTAGLAFALGYGVAVMRRMGASRAVQLIALCFFGLVPIWGSYAQFICKDTLYTAALMVFALFTLELLRGERSLNTKWLIAYGAGGLLASLLRTNGIYVVLPTAVLVVAFGVKGRQRLQVGGALAGALALAFLFSGVVVPALGGTDETASGLYSVCFQQSARVLRDHGEEITPQEYAAIDGVLEAESLPEKYEPWISDPVKYTYRYYGQDSPDEVEALSAYTQAWLQMLRRFPSTYLEAFVAGNSGYYAFTSKYEGETYNNQAGNRFVFETHPQVSSNLQVHTQGISALETPRRLVAMAVRGMRHVPLLSLLLSCATYTWLLVGAGISVARQKKWRVLLGFAPALLSLGVCLLSPANDYFRYFLPIVAMAMPLLVASDGGREKPLKSNRG